jgi:hypothetical protein
MTFVQMAFVLRTFVLMIFFLIACFFVICYNGIRIGMFTSYRSCSCPKISEVKHFRTNVIGTKVDTGTQVPGTLR